MSIEEDKGFPRDYYAVIFTSKRTGKDQNNYQETAERMEKLARSQEGFLGMDTVSSQNGDSITVSYWETEACIQKWKCNAAHNKAQELGKKVWYESFSLRVAKVTREYSFGQDEESFSKEN